MHPRGRTERKGEPSMATQLRLDKLLSDTGRWSRKEAKLLLKQEDNDTRKNA